MEILRLILIVTVILFFIIQMIRKKVSTIIALPCMGTMVALISVFGLVDGDTIGLFSHLNVFGKLDPKTGELMVQSGVMTAVLGEGTKMMSGAVSSAIFGATLAVMLKKLGVIEELVKRIAEVAGDKPMAIAISFFLGTTLLFVALGGLGTIILIGSIALPIMMSSGISRRDSGAIILLGVSAGGVLNAANWTTYTTLLESTGMANSDAYSLIVGQSIMIFIVVFLVSLIFVIFAVKTSDFSRAWAVRVEKQSPKKVNGFLLLAPLVPIIIIGSSAIFNNFNSQIEIINPELGISLGILYVALVSRVRNKGQLVTASVVEGVQEVAGAIALLVGLGILIKGFQYYTVTPLIAPMIEQLVSYLQNPITYIVGFTIATPLVLYRGPLNTFGIGGAIPAIFAASGLNPLATIYVLRATGNLQGFGDPTNSQNIWIADFVKVDPNDITKRLILLGFIMTFIILVLAVILNQGMLG